MSSEILSLLGLAHRAGRLSIGEDMTIEAVADHKVRLLVLASDTAPTTVRRTQKLAGERLPIATLKETKAELGSALGRDTCALCAVMDMGFAAKVAEKLAAENPAFAETAALVLKKSEKIARRKITKPRKKKE
ncbi:MAG: ribosomal L7Ae/L30e/S12e/Gadd45 family protein [Oscillospiraceae bacterium]|nr:ribosomal L7Ae/L30e/S12e/Gadd45 family protein [Oscillospiraceae bacterium]